MKRFSLVIFKLFVAIFMEAFLPGCVMIKIGGVKSAEVRELSRDLREAHLKSFESIKPLLAQDGTLSLWVYGRFTKRFEVKNMVVECGDEWMAIGLFPGFDSMLNGYLSRDGKKEDVFGAFGYHIGANLLFGLPTIGSLLEFLDPTVVPLHSDGSSLAHAGLVGTYKYEGEKYKIKEHVEAGVTTEDSLSPVLLRNYALFVDGVEFSDQDGIVSLGRHITPGESVRFKMVSVPKYPICEPAIFEAIMDNEFWVTCKGDQ